MYFWREIRLLGGIPNFNLDGRCTPQHSEADALVLSNLFSTIKFTFKEARSYGQITAGEWFAVHETVILSHQHLYTQ
jgi:hypothetical protein